MSIVEAEIMHASTFIHLIINVIMHCFYGNGCIRHGTILFLFFSSIFAQIDLKILKYYTFRKRYLNAYILTSSREQAIQTSFTLPAHIYALLFLFMFCALYKVSHYIIHIVLTSNAIF
jgi:hypothetical protein